MAITERQPYTFDRVVRIVITVLVLLALIWLIYTLRNVLLPFFVACLIAYIFEPFVLFNRKIFKLKHRLPAILITLFEALVVCILLGIIFIPPIIAETEQMGVLLKKYATANISIPLLPDSIHQLVRKTIDFDKLSSLLTQQNLQSIMDMAFSFLSSGINLIIGIFGWFIVLLYMIFIMLDYDRLMHGFRMMIPPKYREPVFKIGRDIKNSMNHYFRGQALVAFCVGILFCIGFLIIGMPFAVILGILIGILNLVPYLQLVSLIPATLLCIVYSASGNGGFWPIWIQCMAVYAIVQVIQDLFLTPKIMGKAMGLNPAIILLSLSVWGTLLGFIGLIIALPLTTLVLSYYNQYIIGQKKIESVDNADGAESAEEAEAAEEKPDGK